MTITPDIITYLLVGAIFFLLVWLILLETRIKRFTKGADGRSLEGTIKEILERMDSVDVNLADICSRLDEVDKKLLRNIREVSTVRFNAFGDTGGNQSFASAFINDRGNGVLISSLYGRDRTTVYAKPIKNFNSEYELSKEEKEALKIAKEQQESL